MAIVVWYTLWHATFGAVWVVDCNRITKNFENYASMSQNKVATCVRIPEHKKKPLQLYMQMKLTWQYRPQAKISPNSVTKSVWRPPAATHLISKPSRNWIRRGRNSECLGKAIAALVTRPLDGADAAAAETADINFGVLPKICWLCTAAVGD